MLRTDSWNNSCIRSCILLHGIIVIEFTGNVSEYKKGIIKTILSNTFG